MKTKFLSSMLAVILAIGLLPVSLFANAGSAYAVDTGAAYSDKTELGEAPLQEIPSIETADGSVAVAAGTVIPMNRSRNVASIVAMARALPHSGFDSSKVTAYSVAPNFVPPYAAGSLQAGEIADALNALKMVRYLAGLPYENVAFTPTLNNISQHGAVLMAASNQFSHTPNKPANMDSAFFDIGYRGCSEANIYAGLSNISNAVLGFVADPGANNIELAGHRRWVLKPGGQNFGIGYAKYGNDYYGGSRISMHVFDGPGPYDCEADTYVAWPSSGDFPIQYFVSRSDITNIPNVNLRYPWSINLGAAYQPPNRNEIQLTLTRRRDNTVWTFNASTPNLSGSALENFDGSKHLSVDNSGYGMTKAIIFRPDVTSLGAIKDGDIFDVSLSGIKNASGAPTTLAYSINFFDLVKAMSENPSTNAKTPVITAQPLDITAAVGGAAAVSVTASVSPGVLSYQWYANTTKSNIGGSIITGATGASYNAPTTAAGVKYYYCIITNTDNSATGNKTATVTSAAAAVTVGYVKEGWDWEDGSYYYYINGAPHKGWLQEPNSGYWYYFYEDTGKLHFGWIADGGGNWYYFDETWGALTLGWIVDGAGNWRYFDETYGVLKIGSFKVGDHWYYSDSYGVLKFGWQNTNYDDLEWFYDLTYGNLLWGYGSRPKQ